MKDILLVTPPFTQLNTPYPGTAYIKGFLNTQGVSSYQMDLGIEVILNIFTSKTLTHIFNLAQKNKSIKSRNGERIFALKDHYIKCIDDVILFLQGKNQTLARQICTETFLPQASKFDELDDLQWAFGNMGMQDKAKHLSTLFIEDLADFISECIDENFGFSRYAERLGMSANSFNEIHLQLQKPLSFIDEITIKIIKQKIQEIEPKHFGISVPFPGNLLSAFRLAQYIKQEFPNIKTIMGGGFANTELREISDPRIFEFFDYITLDDGERPLELILKDASNNEFKRTWVLENGEVVYKNDSSLADFKQSEVGTPDYSDLLLDHYISVIEIANPMHSLWSDGRWNKLTMAHGCYWAKCTFCDISLDYIKLYEPSTAKLIVDRIEKLMKQTGESGFHFVDEAAPPSLMKAVAVEIIKRQIVVSWWTNIRFEKSFTLDLCLLLKASGCIGVSGGLEVASDRLLKLIDKGVTVEQVSQVCRNLSDSGIMVHSYLMYGYPSQTVQETIDSLEMVRQMFEQGILQSGFWHQFALTAHSPIGKNPDDYGISPLEAEVTFAKNDIQFKDQTKIDHQKFSAGLKKSLFNFMHGLGYDLPVDSWFDFKTSKTTIPSNFIGNALVKELRPLAKSNSKIVWLGGQAKTINSKKIAKGHSTINFHNKTGEFEITLESNHAHWLTNILEKLKISTSSLLSFSQLKKDYEDQDFSQDAFEIFWFGEEMETLREYGLLVL